MRKNGPHITHLSNADDTILFSSTDTASIQIIHQCLQDYTNIFGQVINLKKSHFYMHPNSGNIQIEYIN